MPSIVLRGDTTSFNCSWDMEPIDKVWAVKWYRGNFEIFRFIADEDPPTKIFKLDNFDVDVSNLVCYLTFGRVKTKLLHNAFANESFLLS